MAVSVTQVGKRSVFGDRRVAVFDLVFSSNYAAGGEALSAATLGFKRIDVLFGLGGAAPSTDRATADVLGYDYATEKVLMYQTGTSADTPLNEKGAEAYITGCSARIMVVGI